MIKQHCVFADLKLSLQCHSITWFEIAEVDLVLFLAFQKKLIEVGITFAELGGYH